MAFPAKTDGHYSHIFRLFQVHRLPPEKLKQREVVHIDIANDKIDANDYNKSDDPTLFKSEKTGRGPLVGKWQESVSTRSGCQWKYRHSRTIWESLNIFQARPIMTCYKLVTCEFKWFGLQNRVEHLIQKSERRLFTNFHRQVFCSMDRWYGLTMDDIRAIEDQTKLELDRVSHHDLIPATRAGKINRRYLLGFSFSTTAYFLFFPIQS